MQFGKNQVPRHYFTENQQLDEVEEEKDLVIMITQDLKVSQQCQLAYSKTSQILGLINHTVEYKHPNILIHTYKHLVRPHLEYCIAAWSPQRQGSIRKNTEMFYKNDSGHANTTI